MERQNSSKEQIRQLLRDAICVLCKNVIAHTVQMKIEALIGITIDSEADVVLININEMFDKSVNDRNAEVHDIKFNSLGSRADVVKAQDSDKHDSTDASYCATTQQPFLALAKYQAGKESSQPLVVVKTEQFSSSVAESYAFKSPENSQQYSGHSQIRQSRVGQSNSNMQVNWESHHSSYEAHPSELEISGETDEHWEQYGDNCEANDVSAVEEFMESNEQYGNGSQYNQHMPDYSAVTKRRRVSNKSNVIARRKPQGKSSNAAVGSWDGGDEGNSWKQLDEDEVSHVTIFTCSRCGIQLKNKQSFKRHKRMHDGIVYRCDGCGKILSRSDHLNAHRRKCPAALEQEPLNDMHPYT